MYLTASSMKWESISPRNIVLPRTSQPNKLETSLCLFSVLQPCRKVFPDYLPTVFFDG